MRRRRACARTICRSRSSSGPGIGAAHIRATVFYENVRALVRPGLATNGTIGLPWGSDRTPIPLVSAEDVARVAVGVLTSPSVPAGAAYPVVGEVPSVGEIVATLGRVLGREVRYAAISDEQWRAGALGAGFNAHAVDHLSQLWRAIRSSGADYDVTETIERLGGKPPRTFEAFVREERSSLLSAAQAAA